eukprot:2916523-Amphidinium_carterae.1
MASIGHVARDAGGCGPPFGFSALPVCASMQSVYLAVLANAFHWQLQCLIRPEQLQLVLHKRVMFILMGWCSWVCGMFRLVTLVGGARFWIRDCCVVFFMCTNVAFMKGWYMNINTTGDFQTGVLHWELRRLNFSQVMKVVALLQGIVARHKKAINYRPQFPKGCLGRSPTQRRP